MPVAGIGGAATGYASGGRTRHPVSQIFLYSLLSESRRTVSPPVLRQSHAMLFPIAAPAPWRSNPAHRRRLQYELRQAIHRKGEGRSGPGMERVHMVSRLAPGRRRGPSGNAYYLIRSSPSREHMKMSI